MRIERGQIFAGKYRIERLLGAGGMGEVYAARHIDLGELVALKLMLDVDESTEGLARFQREARAAVRLKSEFVGRVLDVGRLEDGAPFIVLEYIDGHDLEDVLKERQPLPIADAAGFVAQACEGVAEAHALGMVHRDLKLKNLFLTSRPDGRPLVKILDFGVVKLTNTGGDRTQASLTLTQADAMIGSVHYMSPEQIQMSSKVDARADVWSLGVCLHTLLVGKRPFVGDSVATIIHAIAARPAPSVREFRPEIPQELADVVERALEKNLRRRFQSVAELARALAPHVGDPTLGDRVDAVLRGRPKANVALGASDPVPGPTRDWAPKRAESPVPAQTRPPAAETTTRARARPSDTERVDTAPLGARVTAPTTPGSAPASAPVLAVPGPSAAVATAVVPTSARGPWPLLVAGAVLLVLAATAVAMRFVARVRAAPEASSASPAMTATPRIDNPESASPLGASSADPPSVVVALPPSPAVTTTQAAAKTRVHSVRATASASAAVAPQRGPYDSF